MVQQKLAIVKPHSASERKTRTVVDTFLVTPAIVNGWKSPPFQRPVRENDKVRSLASDLKANGGVWPGIVTLGSLGGETYVIDGQHRKAAFLMAAIAEGYTDVRIHYVESMAEMGEEFVQLNSQLVRMRPDDILRGLEDSVPLLGEIRSRCQCVGYDMVRRGPTTPVVSMATLLRVWKGSAPEIPQSNASGLSTAQLAQTLTDEDVSTLIEFLLMAQAAFGRDAEYYRLWGGLNLSLCMWLYRRIVLTPPTTVQRHERLTKDLFKKCLMSLSASAEYMDWLVGRSLSERDRSPCFARIRGIFLQRLHSETGKRYKFLQPSWSTTASRPSPSS